jgi:5-methylcytosine-specific restriction endonuclease McrA
MMRKCALRHYYRYHEEYLKRRREDYYKNKEYYLQKNKEWRIKNRERKNQLRAEWAKKHPEKERFWSILDNARRRGAKGSFTFEEWEELKKRYNYTCPMCGRKEPEIKLTVDHIVPISKGGTNDISNIQPLCLECNLKKGTKTLKLCPSIQNHSQFQQTHQRQLQLL